jgi:hypothetical protein
MTETSARSIHELQQVTQEYASFSQSRGGLGNVLGGMVGLMSFAALWLLGGIALAALSVGLTLTWLVGKEIIRHRVYRPFGDAQEIWSVSQRRGHAIAAIASGLGLVVLAVLPVGDTQLTTSLWSIPLPYLIVCLAAPWIVWRYLRTSNEILVGFYLLFLSAVAVSSWTPNHILFTVILPSYSVILIVLGVKEHLQFGKLAARLRVRHEGDA